MLVRGNWITPTFNGELRAGQAGLALLAPDGLVPGVRRERMGRPAAERPGRLGKRPPHLRAGETDVRRAHGVIGRTGAGNLDRVLPARSRRHTRRRPAALHDAHLLPFWRGAADGGRTWFVPTGIAAGLAVLAKGPVGILLPGAIIGLFFLWNGQWRRLADRRLIGRRVGGRARGAAMVRGGDGGNPGRVHPRLLGDAQPAPFPAADGGPQPARCTTTPWACWSCSRPGPSSWGRPSGMRGARVALGSPPRRQAGTCAAAEAYRLLLCWFAAYLVVFSVAATKLPNYVLPLYPAMAILTARTLTQWVAGHIRAGAWAAASQRDRDRADRRCHVTRIAGGRRRTTPAVRQVADTRRPGAVGVAGPLPVAGGVAAFVCHRFDHRAGARWSA